MVAAITDEPDAQAMTQRTNFQQRIVPVTADAVEGQVQEVGLSGLRSTKMVGTDL
jgi:hypothetical protein